MKKEDNKREQGKNHREITYGLLKKIYKKIQNNKNQRNEK